MTHLRIEQNNGITEQVSPSVIEKLYEIVHSGNLDSSSNLVGSLNTTGTYLNYVDYLEELFTKNGVRLLIITANKLYLSFEDPTIASYWANSTYGDGVGIDVAAANSVLSIPNDAFLDNTSLQTFNELSSFINCSSLGSKAFCGCTSLTSIDISNVTNISNQCFSASTALTTIGNFNTLITSIPFGCFDSCTSLVINDLNLPNLTTLNAYSFKNTKVKLVSNLGSITSVLNQAFCGCSQLTSAVLPNTVTTIGDGAFSDCSNLLSITLNSTAITSLGSSAFARCTSLLGTLNLPNATVSNYALLETGLTEIYVPLCTNTVWAFTNSANLAHLTIGNPTKIDQNFVYNCPNLEDITFTGATALYNSISGYIEIELDVTTIYTGAFRGCPKLFKLMTLNGTTAPVNLVLNNCTSIGWVAFEGCGISALTITSDCSLDLSFLNCKNLEYVDISGCTEIKNGVFESCTSLTTVVLSNSLTKIGLGAFNGCSSLTGPFTIPSSVTTIGPIAFNGSGITCLIFLGPTPPSSLASWGWINVPVYVPDAAVSDYQAAFAAATNDTIKNNILPISNYNPTS